MKALILSVNRSNWASTKGYELADVEAPVLDEKRDPEDAECAIIAPFLAGVCGTDKGIWFRKAFRDPILGKVTDVGSKVARAGKIKVGDVVTAESHLYCGKCHACLAGDLHVCMN